MVELDIHYRDLQESDAERELQLYGNDETFIHGGRNFKVQFENKVEPETVRDLLKKKITEDNVQAIALGTDKKTIRITTNYRINEESPTIDSEIEEFLYQSLKDGNLLGYPTLCHISRRQRQRPFFYFYKLH